MVSSIPQLPSRMALAPTYAHFAHFEAFSDVLPSASFAAQSLASRELKPRKAAATSQKSAEAEARAAYLSVSNPMAISLGTSNLFG